MRSASALFRSAQYGLFVALSRPIGLNTGSLSPYLALPGSIRALGYGYVLTALRAYAYAAPLFRSRSMRSASALFRSAQYGLFVALSRPIGLNTGSERRLCAHCVARIRLRCAPISAKYGAPYYNQSPKA